MKGVITWSMSVKRVSTVPVYFSILFFTVDVVDQQSYNFCNYPEYHFNMFTIDTKQKYTTLMTRRTVDSSSLEKVK